MTNRRKVQPIGKITVKTDERWGDASFSIETQLFINNYVVIM